MNNEGQMSDSLIEYPCDFPIKIMGEAVAEFDQAIFSTIGNLRPEFDAGRTEFNESRTGKFKSLTCYVPVNSRAELDEVYHALSSHPLVKMVL